MLDAIEMIWIENVSRKKSWFVTTQMVKYINNYYCDIFIINKLAALFFFTNRYLQVSCFFLERETLNDTQCSWTVLTKVVKMESIKWTSEMSQKSQYVKAKHTIIFKYDDMFIMVLWIVGCLLVQSVSLSFSKLIFLLKLSYFHISIFGGLVG